MSALGNRIKMRREELGMSQDALAISCGYTSRTTISKIESGANDVSQRKLERIAKALDTTPEYLLGLDLSVPETEEERELLVAYNSLSVDNRKLIDDLLDRLLRSQG